MEVYIFTAILMAAVILIVFHFCSYLQSVSLNNLKEMTANVKRLKVLNQLKLYIPFNILFNCSILSSKCTSHKHIYA